MKKTLLFISILSFSGILCSQIDYNKSVGSTAGNFEVNLNGAATYEVPIFTLPGLQGLQPNISLVYNSQAGVGVMGRGWSISGLSAISRAGKSLHYDNKIEGLKFDATDHFVLDGSMLIPVGGVSYTTEQESFSKIERVGGTAADPTSFKVQAKDGKILYYEAISKLGDGKVISWHLTCVEDENRNLILFSYTYYGNFAYIKDIFYGGNLTANTSSTYCLSFHYAPQSGTEKYAYGRLLPATLILEKITFNDKVEQPGRIARQYDFIYDASENNVLYLKRITEKNAAGESFNSTVFSWDVGVDIPAYGQETSYSLPPNNTSFKNAGCFVADVNGDGKEEIVSIKNGVVTVADAQSSSGLESINLGVSDKVLFADVNGDGLMDIIDFNAVGVYVSLADASYANIYQSRTKWLSVNMTKAFRSPLGWYDGPERVCMADMNGDGLADIIHCISLSETKVYLSNGTSEFVLGNTIQTPITGTLKVIDSTDKKYFADINGDGLIDIVQFVKRKTLSNDSSYINIFLNDKGNFSLSHRLTDLDRNTIKYIIESETSYASYKLFATVIDMNGDGLADIVLNVQSYITSGNIKVALSKGDGSFTAFKNWDVNFPANIYMYSSSMPDKYPFIIRDLNADGLPDFCRVVDNKIYFAENTGESLVYKGYKSFDYNPNSQTLLVGFLYGSGSLDFAKITASDGSIKLLTAQLLAMNDGHRRIGHIKNGLGQQIILTYVIQKNENYPVVYDLPYITPVYPYMVANGHVPVVDLAEFKDEKGQSVSWNRYKYYNPIIHLKGKGFLGFQQIGVEEVRGGGTIGSVVSRSRLMTDKALMIPATLTWVYKGGDITSGTLIGRTYTGYDVVEKPNNYILKRIETKSYDFLNLSLTHSQYSYDDNGNITEANTAYRNCANVGDDYCGTVVASEKTTINYKNVATWNFKPTKTVIVKTFNGETLTRTDSIQYSGIRAVKKITEPANSEYRVEESYAYDNFGNPTSVILSAAGLSSFTTSYEYDPTGRYLTKGTNTLGHFIKYENYNSLCVQPTKITDPNNLSTQIEYDAWGRRIKSTSPNGNIAWSSIKWVPQNCKIPKAVYYTLDTAGGQMPSYTFYDALDREVCHYTYTDFAGAYNIYTDTRYDNKGRVWKKSLPYSSINTADDSKQWIAYEYDNLGRLKKETGPYLNKSYSYGLRTVTETDHLNNNVTVTKEYDLLGNLTKTTDAGGSIVYTYNAQGLPVKVVAAGQTTTMAYDLMGRRIRITDPDAGTTTSQYNKYGQLIKQTDANGNFTTYTYDGLGRMKTKYVNGNATVEGSAVYNYDSGTKAIGKLSSVIAPNHETYYAYDASVGFLSAQKEKIFGTEYLTNYAYNNLGQVSRVTYPGGFATKHYYDVSGALRKLTDSQDKLIYAVSDMNKFGQVTEEAYGNETGTYRFYNTFGLPTIVRTGNKVNGIRPPNSTIGNPSPDEPIYLMVASGFDLFVPGVSNRPDILTASLSYYIENVQNLNYTYNDRGMMLSRACNNSGQREFFSYDKLARLTKAENTKYYDPNGENTFEYNNMGNILYKSDVGSMQYSTLKPHAVTTLKFEGLPLTPPYNYLKTDYTPFNKISSAANQTLEGQWYDSYEFKYGNDQQRIRMEMKQKQPEASTSKTLRTYTYINGLYEEEKNEQTGSIRKLHYIKANGKTIAIFVKETNKSDSMYWIHTDHLGSYDVITDANGNIVEKLSFDAWGNRRNPIDWREKEAPGTPHLFSRGFTGHEHLDRYGVINMNGRLYDPTIGRFFSPDPFVVDATFTQDFNRYSYARNNPLSYIDPSGENPLAFAIFFAVGAYLGGSLVNQSLNPFNGSWDWKNPATYIGMTVGGLMGGSLGAMGWGVVSGTSGFNLVTGFSVGNIITPMANFAVSSSGILLQGLGYVTAAGGGIYLAKSLLNKQIEDYTSSPYSPVKWDGEYFTGTEEEARSIMLSDSKAFKVETSGFLTSKGYFFEPIQGEAYGVLHTEILLGKYFDVLDYNHPLGFQKNDIKSAYRYTQLHKTENGLYIGANFMNLARVIYRIHTHPANSPESGSDLIISRVIGLPGVIFGWGGSIYRYGFVWE